MQVFDVTYEISLHVATTAEVLRTEMVAVGYDPCPMFFRRRRPIPETLEFVDRRGLIELMVKPFVNPP